MKNLAPSLFATSAVLFAACSNPGTACVNGMTIACACPGGRSGVQTCHSGSYDSCICDGVDAGNPGLDGSPSDTPFDAPGADNAPIDSPLPPESGVDSGTIPDAGPRCTAVATPTFGTYRDFSTGTDMFASLRPYYLDVDLDGDLDVIVVTSSSLSVGYPARIAVLRNDGVGNLTLRDPMPIGPLVFTSVSPMDIDRDGDPDLVAMETVGAMGASTDCILHTYRNDGTGHFTEWTARSFAMPQCGQLWRSPIEISGVVRLISAEAGSAGLNTLVPLTPMPDGTFVRESPLPMANAVDALVDDWDGDGHRDDYSPHGPVCLGDAGTFTCGPGPMGVSGVSGWNLDADFNGDGRLDLVGYQSHGTGAPGRVFVALRSASGGFDPPSAFTLQIDDVASVHSVADVDCDGDIDVLVYGQRNRPYIVMLNDGFGQLSQTTVIPAPPPTPSWLDIVDLNGDGRGDVTAMVFGALRVYFQE